MFVLYNLLLTLLAPLWVPWMLWRTARRKEKPNWKERQGDFGFEPRKDRHRVWVHAVSVGEVMAALPILRELGRELPDFEIVLSVTTSSGHQTAREKAADLADKIVYFPIDVARFQLAAMQRVRPAAVAIMETELWLNFLWAAKTFEAATLLVNGRISDRSFRRSKPVRFFYRALLKDVDRCLMQTEADAERIRAMGGRDVQVLGNCKFDQAAEGLDADPAEWREKLGLTPGKLTVVVGSTRGEEEEKFVLEALKLAALDAQIVHAPRHIERADALCEQVRAAFGAVAQRSKGETGAYLVLDTYGELAGAYATADIAIVGGGFANLGGQNLIQPLALGKPVLHGPHMQNFREAALAAKEAGASLVCATPQELADALALLARDADKRAEMGAKAKALVEANLGASKRYAKAIADAARGALSTR